MTHVGTVCASLHQHDSRTSFPKSVQFVCQDNAMLCMTSLSDNQIEETRVDVIHIVLTRMGRISLNRIAPFFDDIFEHAEGPMYYAS